MSTTYLNLNTTGVKSCTRLEVKWWMQNLFMKWLVIQFRDIPGVCTLCIDSCAGSIHDTSVCYGSHMPYANNNSTESTTCKFMNCILSTWVGEHVYEIYNDIFSTCLKRTGAAQDGVPMYRQPFKHIRCFTIIFFYPLTLLKDSLYHDNKRLNWSERNTGHLHRQRQFLLQVLKTPRERERSGDNTCTVSVRCEDQVRT